MPPSNPSGNRRLPPAVYIYLRMSGARGCGHIGLLARHADGSYVKYWQTAENSNDAVFKLLVFRNAMRVRRVEFSKSRPFYLLTRHCLVFRVPGVNPAALVGAVKRYEQERSMYNSLTNNCTHFVTFILRHSGHPTLKGGMIPNSFFFSLRRQFRHKSRLNAPTFSPKIKMASALTPANARAQKSRKPSRP